MTDHIRTEELGRLVGVSANTIRALERRGVIQKIARGRYDASEAVPAYCAHLREVAAGRGGEGAALDLTRERAELARAQTVGHELKNAALRGDLVSKAEVLSGWAEIVRRIRSRLLAVPARVQARAVHLLTEDIDIIDAEVRQALEELADDRA